jgi:threonine aldolase
MAAICSARQSDGRPFGFRPATDSCVRLPYPTEVNAVFAYLPPGWHQRLADKGRNHYTFIGRSGARIMCSWATTDRDVEALLADVYAAAQHDTAPASYV